MGETLVQVGTDCLINVMLALISLHFFNVAYTTVYAIFIIGLLANLIKSYAVRRCFNAI